MFYLNSQSRQNLLINFVFIFRVLYQKLLWLVNQHLCQCKDCYLRVFRYDFSSKKTSLFKNVGTNGIQYEYVEFPYVKYKFYNLVYYKSKSILYSNTKHQFNKTILILYAIFAMIDIVYCMIDSPIMYLHKYHLN